MTDAPTNPTNDSRHDEDSLQEQARRETKQRHHPPPGPKRLTDESGDPTFVNTDTAPRSEEQELRRDIGAMTPQPDENPDQRRKLAEQAPKTPVSSPPIESRDG